MTQFDIEPQPPGQVRRRRSTPRPLVGFCAAIVLLGHFIATAESSPPAFEAANRLYLEGKFSEAATTYGILEQREAGGAWVKTGNYMRVWRRLPNGAWKLAFDVLSPRPKPAPKPAGEKKP